LRRSAPDNLVLRSSGNPCRARFSAVKSRGCKVLAANTNDFADRPRNEIAADEKIRRHRRGCRRRCSDAVRCGDRRRVFLFVEPRNGAQNRFRQQDRRDGKKIADDKAAAPVSAADINDKYGKSVVFVEVAWRLIDTSKQAQVYHQFVPNSREVLSKLMGVNYGTGPIDPTAGSAIPVYIQAGGSYEPILTNEKNALSVPIGGRHTGTGFIVTNDGFVLTNRHVAATWMTTYQFPPDTPRGIVLTPAGQLASSSLQPPPRDWVPANTKQEGKQLRGSLKGVDDTLDVTLAGKESRMAAQLKQTSDRHDVALIKVDVPGQLTKVELFDNYDTLKKGEAVTIMGYPAASPPVYGVIKSSDMFNQGAQAKLIPDPTVTTTNIGNIIRSNDQEKDKRVSVMGDVIQLATGSTGAGNSGGPVFDN